jgi:hypothetical protein
MTSCEGGHEGVRKGVRRGPGVVWSGT